MQLVLLLLWIKAAQGLYLGRKKSESMNEDDVSILHTYNAMVHTKSEDEDLSMLPFHMEENDAKPTKRKNLKKMISKGKLGAAMAGESSSYDVHGMEMMVSGDSTFGAKFVPIAPVDGYEAEAEQDSETEDVSSMEDIEDSDVEEVSDKEVAEGSEDEAEENDSETEVAEGSDEGSEDEEGSEGESEGSDSSDSSDSSSDSDSSSTDSDSSSSDSDSSSSDSSSSSSSSSSDSEDDEKVPDYYNGESDYVYTYEWDDTDKQVTGSDYEYSYEWAYKEENHEEH